MIDDDPKHEEDYRDDLAALVIVRDTLRPLFGADRPETGQDYLDAYPDEDGRPEPVPTRSGMGVLVPDDLYEPLETEGVFATADGRTRVDPAALTAASTEAFDLLRQGFPGAALELGHNLWVWGDEHPVCYNLLDAAYQALGREPLRKLLADARALRQHWATGER